MKLNAGTRLFAILGDPVAHTLSPTIHNAAISARGIDAVYVALRCADEEVAGLISGIAHAGGGGNVTVPHKGVAARAVQKPSARVRATGACNTYWGEKGKTFGENTDVIGFSKAVQSVLEDVRGARALVIGAGGSARAVLYALLEDGAAGVTVLARNRVRVAEIAAVAGRRAKRVACITNESLLRDEGYDLVVNTTPLGMRQHDRFPIALNKLAALTAVFDVVYKRGSTEWVRYARSLGIPADDGAEMLIQQAAAAFELWFESRAPIEVMRRAFEG